MCPSEKLREHLKSTTIRFTSILLGTALLTTPVAASHGSLACDVPADLVPLFDLLDTFTELALLGGVAFGTLGLAIAGIMFMWPGQDMNRRAKRTATNVVIGTIILLSASMIISFITSQLGTTLC